VDDIKLTNLPEEEEKKKESEEELKDVRGGISSEPVYLTANTLSTTSLLGTASTNPLKTITTPTLTPDMVNPLAGK